MGDVADWTEEGVNVLGVCGKDSMESISAASRVIRDKEDWRDIVELVKGPRGPGWDFPGKFLGLIPGDLIFKWGHLFS